MGACVPPEELLIVADEHPKVMTTYIPPFPPYDPKDKSGFSYETVTKRWPIILTKLIDTIYTENVKLSGPKGEFEEENRDRIVEGRSIIQQLDGLKYGMARDRALESIPDDGEPHVALYNSLLEQLKSENKNTWFRCPWLYAECYLYRLIRSHFSRTAFWKDYDPFHQQKEETFRSSAAAIFQLSHTFSELDEEKATLDNDPAKLEVLFNEILQICLWGNATDLSLLTNMTHEDIQKLQSVGGAAQADRKEFILLDDSHLAWEVLSKMKDGRVDIVLDNAGFELFTDFLLADFLVTHTNYVSKVVFHPKTIPWFVSDVIPENFYSLIPSLLNASFFGDFKASEEQAKDLKTLVNRWKAYLESGQFSLSVEQNWHKGEPSKLGDFWTSPSPYAAIQNEAPALLNEMKGSGLVIFKGDLNYRKLTADVKWPPSTSFPTALGPFAGLLPTLSLRTAKADVVVGITEELAKELDAKDPKWRVNGKYALISFCGKH